MSLLDEFTKDYILLDKERIPDGQGGFKTTWKETNVVLHMAEKHGTTIEARVAEQEGTASTYTFYPPKGTQLEYHDVLKRVSDGEIFRITSHTGEKETPAMSNLNLGYVTAEIWRLPT